MKTVKFKESNDGNHFKAQPISEILNNWHLMHYEYLPQAREVILRGMWPPINAMDDSMELLEECVILSISKNMIEKISNLSGLKNLKVLSLAQNNIKSLKGLEMVGETLEVLIIARNFIKETKGIEDLFRLKELDISYNYINQPNEFTRISSCEDLKSLAFKENPLAKKYPDHIWRKEALKVLPELETLDYITVEEDERTFKLKMSEISQLKGNAIVKNSKYTIYDEMFREAQDQVMQSKLRKTSDEDFYSSNLSFF